MFEITTINNKQGITSIQLYELLEISKQYSTWVKYTLVKNELFEPNIDFHTLGYESSSNKINGGRPREDYWLSLDCAKEVCMLSRSLKAKALRKAIIKLLNEHAEGEWITVKQGKMLFEFLNYFKYIDNQTKTEKIALEYLKNAHLNKPTGVAYGLAHKQRNVALNYSANQVRSEYETWCKENCQKIHGSLTKSQMTYYFNKYLLVRNAIWDFLIVKGYQDNPVEIGSFVATIAKEWGIEIYPKNEDNLFQQKEKELELEYDEMAIKLLKM